MFSCVFLNEKTLYETLPENTTKSTILYSYTDFSPLEGAASAGSLATLVASLRDEGCWSLVVVVCDDYYSLDDLLLFVALDDNSSETSLDHLPYQ
jgi:hypothetical protein